MNIKSSVCLIAISSILYGCSTAPTYSVPPQSAPTIPPDKVVGDGSHLLGLPMTRDFITNPSAYTSEANTNYQKAVVKVSEEINAGQKTTSNLPDKKIFSIKPVGDVKPRAVILLKKDKINNQINYTFKMMKYKVEEFKQREKNEKKKR